MTTTTTTVTCPKFRQILSLPSVPSRSPFAFLLFPACLSLVLLFPLFSFISSPFHSFRPRPGYGDSAPIRGGPGYQLIKFVKFNIQFGAFLHILRRPCGWLFNFHFREILSVQKEDGKLFPKMSLQIRYCTREVNTSFVFWFMCRLKCDS